VYISISEMSLFTKSLKSIWKLDLAVLVRKVRREVIAGSIAHPRMTEAFSDQLETEKRYWTYGVGKKIVAL